MSEARGRASSLVVVTNRRAGSMDQLDQALSVLRDGAPGLAAVDTEDPLFEEALRGVAGRTVVAAGGDGTLHVLAQQLWRLGLLADTVVGRLANDPTAAAFEEVHGILQREATMDAGKVAAMVVAGAVAAVGVLTNSVHLVIGGMVIAPGFQPFLKVAFRVAGAARSFRRGLFDIGAGWSALVVGAAAAALVLRLSGVSVSSPAGGYLTSGSLLAYWRDWTLAATVVAVVGGVAGTALVIANRAVLTAGVMITLALVPGAALAGIAAVEGDLRLATEGVLRWAHDALIVTAVGAAVFALYRAHRRRGVTAG